LAYEYLVVVLNGGVHVGTDVVERLRLKGVLKEHDVKIGIIWHTSSPSDLPF
jgi:hypothetical protein